MKKFFALVLALVMALSLTTVAWGASYTVSTLADLQAKVDAAVAGDEITLDTAVTIDSAVTFDPAVAVTIKTGNLVDPIEVVAGGKLTLGANVTIDGNSESILVNGGELIVNGATIKGKNYDDQCTVGMVAGTITINSGLVTTDGSQTSTVASAIGMLGGTLNINGGTVSATTTAPKIGSAAFAYGGTINVYGGTVTNGNQDTAVSNALIAAGATAVVNVYGGTVDSVLAHANAGSEVNVSGGTVGAVAAKDGSSATISGGTVTGTVVENGGNVTVSGGTFTDDVSEYVAPGMSLVGGSVVNNAGQFVGSSSALTSSKATYGATLAAALANKTETVEVKAAVAAAPAVKSFATYQVFVTNTANKTVSVLPNQYVVVPTDVNADIVVVDGSKIVYLAEVGSGVKYTDVAKAVKVAYNAKPACGDVYVAAAADAGTYYLYKDAYYVECADADATILFSVDGMAVCAKETNLVKTLAHTYAFDTKKVANVETVTAVYCTACKASFSFVVGDVADAVKTFGAGNYADTGLNDANGDDIFVRTASGVVYVPVTGTTSSTVQSAQTFDAGIAMYVGMSVMAAAGGAVVIGKKKD